MRKRTAGASIIALALAATGAWAVARFATKPGLDSAPSHARTLGTPRACELYNGLPDVSSSSNGHAGMVWVPAGSFIVGSRHGYVEERPASESTRVEGFWIDRTEVTNAQFTVFVEATGFVTEAERGGASAVFEPRTTPDGSSTEEVAVEAPTWWRHVRGANWRHPEGPASSLKGRMNEPVVQVTFADATAYARWRGGELPTEVQWEFAARSGGALDDAGVPEDDAGRPTANYWQGQFPSENTVEDGYRARAPVGCFPANSLGVHDMIGNVWELTRDPYRGQRPAHCTGNVEGPKDMDEESAVIKGGSFLCAASYCARYRATARHPHEAHLAAAHVGFRTIIEASH